MILEWAVTQYSLLEEQPGKKCIYYARILQNIVRQALAFFQQLLKVNYLAGVNLQSYCYYFRDNKHALEETTDLVQGQNLMYKTSELVKMMLYKQAMLPIADILFNEKRQCFDRWTLFSGSIIESVCAIYGTICSGTFKLE